VVESYHEPVASLPDWPAFVERELARLVTHPGRQRPIHRPPQHRRSHGITLILRFLDERAVKEDDPNALTQEVGEAGSGSTALEQMGFGMI
jgi:hypothetical protein